MYIPYDYDAAARWLRKSKRVVDRDKERTMYWGHKGARLIRRSSDTIGIYVPWINSDIATYHSNGDMFIHTPQTYTTHWGGTYTPLRSQGLRYMLRLISGVENIYIKKGVTYLLPKDAPRTPSKIQGCRSCKSSGKIDWTCWPDTCHQARYSGNYSVCPEHKDAAVNVSGWHEIPCEHGKTQRHTVYRSRDCYYCGGKGRREYGNNPIALVWDGSPIRIKDGKLVKKEPSELEKRIAAYVQVAD